VVLVALTYLFDILGFRCIDEPPVLSIIFSNFTNILSPPLRTCPVGPAKFALCNGYVRRGGGSNNVFVNVEYYERAVKKFPIEQPRSHGLPGMVCRAESMG
jgi:hypothetical protein